MKDIESTEMYRVHQKPYNSASVFPVVLALVNLFAFFTLLTNCVIFFTSINGGYNA